ncbi:RNA polymerase II transcriptional coactivator KELP-like [Momordica charantia]|uniref:RNA polymerase II transcriptional coactivator KELP-like n=1 Tax=Momordica charantia TaxID=3673 RepID=A0A6J1C8V0_MOMCH|nr:RNA polymerase II transcriptional coactivator KELP-like [Momordica charantia]
MDADIQRRIKETVRNILESSDMDEMTESKIRTLASKELDLDLSRSSYKALVRQVVESFLEERAEEQPQEEQEGAPAKEKEYDDDGDLVVCWLSSKRKVTIQDFRGKTLVSIREFYRKDDKDLPTAKGISLTEEQWSVFKKNVPDIEKAIKNMQSRIM